MREIAHWTAPLDHIGARADGVIHYADELGFVPGRYMDNPEETKTALREAYARLLDLDFDMLLVAHGIPLISGAKDGLRRFSSAGAEADWPTPRAPGASIRGARCR